MYRLYCFTNSYFLGIQAGIQSAHALQRLNTKYATKGSVGYGVLQDWAQNHETIIILNGGWHNELISKFNYIGELCSRLGYPFAKFEESVSAANGCMTAICMIVSETVYNIDNENCSCDEKLLNEFIYQHKLAT